MNIKRYDQETKRQVAKIMARNPGDIAVMAVAEAGLKRNDGRLFTYKDLLNLKYRNKRLFAKNGIAVKTYKSKKRKYVKKAVVTIPADTVTSDKGALLDLVLNSRLQADVKVRLVKELIK